MKGVPLVLKTLVFLVMHSNASRKPHIVYILADDLGFNDVGYHAREHESLAYTPFIDRLAGEGVRLENYYVQPICSPTRGQLLSGRYQIHTGMQHEVIHRPQPRGLPLDNILLPEQLRQCGYKTHMLGKWHLGFYKDEYLPWKRGFDTYFGYLVGAEDYYTKVACMKKTHRESCGVSMVDSQFGDTNSTWGEYSADLYVRKAREIFQNHDPDKPMFLYLALQHVHAPIQVPSKYLTRVPRFRHKKKDKIRRTYLAMVSALDEMVKNITTALKEANLWDDTLLVFSTDNGGRPDRGGNNWPLRGAKNSLWEGGIRGIGFVHGNLIEQKPNITRDLIHVSDWLPTLMTAARCKLASGTPSLDGVDQWNTISKGLPGKRTEILHNIDPLFEKISKPELRSGFDTSVHAAIRSGKWKLITGKAGYDNSWFPPPESTKCCRMKPNEPTADKPIRLFNIVEDPYEENDLSESYPQMVDLLLEKLAEYNATAVPVIFPKMDRKAYPGSRGGFWGPWKN
ncbi:unnamed protein product [Clavelina lepadiformis]|uniref:Sulfatase N-terminal domain-containing protein n=1 Tax=Clavelina lepadiformis TaxID=159417 RepID=A0ABP0FD65_CLALP